MAGLIPSSLSADGPMTSLATPLPLSGCDLVTAERNQNTALLAYLVSQGIPIPDCLLPSTGSQDSSSASLSPPVLAPVLSSFSQVVSEQPVLPVLPGFGGCPLPGSVDVTGSELAGLTPNSLGLRSTLSEHTGSLGQRVSLSSADAGPVGPGVVPKGRRGSNLNLLSAAPFSSVAGGLFGEQDFPPLSPAPLLATSFADGVSAVASSPSPLASVASPPAPAWRGIVGELPTQDCSLSYFPPAPSEGDVIIKPPVDFLRKGNRLWASSLVGSFLTSRLPFKRVESFAFRVWGSHGLQKVFLHPKGYFIFRFQSAMDRDNVLASGPWYISNKLLLLKPWKEDLNFLDEVTNKIPVWVRLYNVPFAYWTMEGLSYLASGIGKPLFMDQLTAKLEPLHFARVCIEITAGAQLPDQIFATILDEGSGEESLLAVRIEYQSKPQVCGVCSSFGHSQLKCPQANFQWVPRSSAPSSALTIPSEEILKAPPQGSLPKPVPKGAPPKAIPKSSSSKAPPKGSAPKALPTGSLPNPKGAPPKAGPKGSSPKAHPKGSSPKAPSIALLAGPEGSPLPKPISLHAGPSKASSAGDLLIPIAGDREVPVGPPEGFSAGSPEGLSPEVLLCPAVGSSPKASLDGCCLISGSRFSVLAGQAEEDRDSAPSDDEPPSWGPLVRRLKAIDGKAGRALMSSDVGRPLRAQPKQKKKKSPKGK